MSECRKRCRRRWTRRAFLGCAGAGLVGWLACRGDSSSTRVDWTKAAEAPHPPPESSSPTPDGNRIEIDLTPYREALRQPGSGVAVTVPPDLSLLLVRTERGRLRAFVNICTHQACPLEPDPEHRWIRCDPPCGHGARFSLDGEVLVGPATRKLYQYLAIESADGTRLIIDRNVPL